MSEVALDQLAIFESEGANLRQIAIGHCDSHPYLDYYLRLAELGVFMSFDNIGSGLGHLDAAGNFNRRIANLIRELIDRGYHTQLLLSHDICESFQLSHFGGPGFGYLKESFLPLLTSLGVSEVVLDEIITENPRRWLTIPE